MDEIKPCPFCGSPAQEGPLWPKHYGCSNENCGAHHANLSTEQWNRRPPITVEERGYTSTSSEFPFALSVADKAAVDAVIKALWEHKQSAHSAGPQQEKP